MNVPGWDVVEGGLGPSIPYSGTPQKRCFLEQCWEALRWGPGPNAVTSSLRSVRANGGGGGAKEREASGRTLEQPYSQGQVRVKR